MGLQRFPYKKFHGLSAGDGPFDIDPAMSVDLYNVVPRNYQTLEGIQSRQSAKQCVRKHPDGSPGTVITVPDTLDGGMYWPLQSKFIFATHSGLIRQQSIGVGTTPPLLYTPPGGTPYWDFVTAPNNAGAETLWCLPVPTGGTSTAVPQKWDGVAATTSAWAGGVPNPAPLAPTTPSGVCYWRGRIIVWNIPPFRQRLFYSDPLNPESPAAANYGNNFQDFFDDTDRWGLTMCVPHQESLIVFERKGVWQVYDPVTFANRRLASGIGCYWRDQAVSHPNGRVYFISGTRELYSISLRGDLELESFAVRDNVFAFGGGDKDQLVLSPFGSIIWKQGFTNEAWEFIPKKPGEGAWFRHRFGGAANAPTNNYWFLAQIDDNQGYAVVGTQLFLGGNDCVLTEYFSQWAPRPGTLDVDRLGVLVNMSPIPYIQSSWRPFLTEEPVERVRRVHTIGAGDLILDMYAEPTPKAAPVPKFTSPAFNLGSTSTPDRGFSTHRPETRGRYHAFKIRGVAAFGFAVDELEFAFRGGKEHAQ